MKLYQKKNTNIFEVYLTMGGANSLHDEVFDKLLMEHSQFMGDVAILNTTNHPQTERQREEM